MPHDSDLTESSANLFAAFGSPTPIDTTDDAAVAAWIAQRAEEETRLCLSSGDIASGDVFFAVPGARSDGRRFVFDALTRGAAAMVVEASEAEPAGETAPMRLAVRHLKKRLGCIAAAYYGYPARAMTGVAVTGTNGKTTVSWWVRHLADAFGHPTGSIGTVGCWFKGKARERFESPLTTPDALTLHAMLSDLHEAGAQAFVLEASSAGLLEGRLMGLDLSIAVFTNLTRDHLDLHGTMEAYRNAKKILFEAPSLKEAVLNADDPAAEHFAQTCRARGVRVWSFSTKGRMLPGTEHALFAQDVREHARGSCFTIRYRDETHPVTLSHPGSYNIENALAAAAVLIAMGVPLSAVAEKLTELPAPPGRMERLDVPDAPLVVVDYCHTPDAFEQILTALRLEADLRKGRLTMVFGCCGDRDQGKRPVMGAVAERLADRVWVTSDNPRWEDPARIAQEILAGMTNPDSARVELDRARAIEKAVREAQPCDVIILAGKGPETHQILADGAHHHSDRACALAAMMSR